jgi:HEAT repeat protein
LRAVRPLVKALGDDKNDVRLTAAESLEDMGESALGSLKKALETEKDEKIREKLKKIAEKITKQ